jgi:hypothetical protein
MPDELNLDNLKGRYSFVNASIDGNVQMDLK